MTFRRLMRALPVPRRRGPAAFPPSRWTPPDPVPWWEYLALPHGTMTMLTAQAADYDAALDSYVRAVLTDIAERGWRRVPPRAARPSVVVPLATRPPRLPPVA